MLQRLIDEASTKLVAYDEEVHFFIIVLQNYFFSDFFLIENERKSRILLVRYIFPICYANFFHIFIKIC